MDDAESLKWLCEAFRRHTAGMGSGLSSFQAMQNFHGVAALRRLTANDALPYGVSAVFAGGTCLALGHRLTERYSEDIDIVLVGAGGMSNTQREAVLDAVEAALFSTDGIAHAGGRRSQNFIQQELSYRRTVEEASYPDSELKVRVDAGFADQLPDGDIEAVQVETFLSLRGDRPFASQFNDLQPLEVPAVKPRVVLVEKMIALHQRAEAGQTNSLRTRARDVFDIGCLIEHEPTLKSLSEPGFTAADIDNRQMQRDQKTPTAALGKKRLQIRRPTGGFAESPIWQHGTPMYQALRQSYNSMGGLIYDKSKKPIFEDVVKRVHEIRHLL